MYFLVSYDLRAPGRDYSRLAGALKNFTICRRCLESVWIIGWQSQSDFPTMEIARYLKQFMDPNDKLLVVALSGDWASIGLKAEDCEWIRARLSPK